MTDSGKTARIKYFTTDISRAQAIDTGMAMVLICLILYVYTQKAAFIPVAIILLLVNMIWPLCFKPIAIVWLGGAGVLGTVVSTVVLSLIFYLLVTPVGILRRLTGADPMQLKKWKKGTGSVFRIRNHPYQPADIEKPF